jgi:hypothetical protein
MSLTLLDALTIAYRILQTTNFPEQSMDQSIRRNWEHSNLVNNNETQVGLACVYE